MRYKFLFKKLSSLPVILIMFYFIPFLGICLMLLRYILCNSKNKILTPVYLVIIRILILIPKLLITNIIKIDINKIPYLKDIINTTLYNKQFLSYGKQLVCIGIIFLIISFILKVFFSKANKIVKDYITQEHENNLEISIKNDTKIKVKQEKLKKQVI